jgi:hypothetical protein
MASPLQEPFFSGYTKLSCKQKSHGTFPWLLLIDPESWEGLPCPRLIFFRKGTPVGRHLSPATTRTDYFDILFRSSSASS